jgi:hypothetical protein
VPRKGSDKNAAAIDRIYGNDGWPPKVVRGYLPLISEVVQLESGPVAIGQRMNDLKRSGYKVSPEEEAALVRAGIPLADRPEGRGKYIAPGTRMQVQWIGTMRPRSIEFMVMTERTPAYAEVTYPQCLRWRNWSQASYALDSGCISLRIRSLK